ncbi:Fc receptor-like protein 5 [Arapaima gigas]
MKLSERSTWTYAIILVYFACMAASISAPESSPQVVLTADPPWSEMYPGDTVTLTCRLTGSEQSLEGWNFTWSRIAQQSSLTKHINSTGESGNVYVLVPVRESDQGMYQCIGHKGSEYFYSNSHNVTVSGDRPQAVVTQDPPFPVLFAGENVMLKCEIRKGSQWRYSWAKKNRQNIVKTLTSKNGEDHQTHTLQSVTETDSGEYLCHAEKVNNPVIQLYSGSLTLRVLGEKPKAVIKISVLAGEIYTGEKVTLSCAVEGGSAGWKYLWYKDNQGTALSNTDSNSTDGSSYTINFAALSHHGWYWCQANRGQFYSQYSDSLKMNIQALPQPLLTAPSGWTSIFPSESVTLRCDVQWSSTEWLYKWYRDGQELPAHQTDSFSINGNTYTVLSAAPSHSGQYQCRGELPKRAVNSLLSNHINLTVYGTVGPDLQLSVDPPSEDIYTGESVTLSCAVEGGSVGWKYLWYKDTQGAALSNIDSNSTDGSSYTISFAALSHHGQYWCQTTRGQFYSQYSDSLNVIIKGKV